MTDTCLGDSFSLAASTDSFAKMSQSDEQVAFCCCKLKKTPKTVKAVAVAEKTMEDVFQAVFDSLHKEAADKGIAIPDEFKAKLIKLGVEHNLFPPAEVQK